MTSSTKSGWDNSFFDRSTWQWSRRDTRGDIVIVRYVDDFVVGFQHQSDAEPLLRALRVRGCAIRIGSALGQDASHRVRAIDGSRQEPNPSIGPQSTSSSLEDRDLLARDCQSSSRPAYSRWGGERKHPRMTSRS